MEELSILQSKRNKALENYKFKMLALRNPDSSSTVPPTKLAQEANDAWLEFKKIDSAVKNLSFMSSLKLYGC